LPHPEFVLDLAVGPESKWLVTGGLHGGDELRIWDVATARLRQKISLHGLHFYSLRVSPDGTRLAATGQDQKSKAFRLAVYDIASCKPLFSTEGWPLAYSPDGRWLVIQPGDENTMLLLDARTHKTIAQFIGHEGHVYKAAFSSDSRLLASCGVDRTVRLWQIENGTSQILSGHTDEVYAVAFHPDGTRLASAGRDGAIWLWDLARGEQVMRLPGHTSYIWSLAFSPDGATLASSSGDATVRLWDTAPLGTRYQARRAAASFQPEAERLVEQLWRAKNDPSQVADAIRGDRALSEALRQAALRAVLRRARPPDADLSKPQDPP
jgi:WD40 repeat protein